MQDAQHQAGNVERDAIGRLGWVQRSFLSNKGPIQRLEFGPDCLSDEYLVKATFAAHG